MNEWYKIANLSGSIIKQLNETFASTEERITCSKAAHVIVDAVQLTTLTRNNHEPIAYNVIQQFMTKRMQMRTQMCL